MVCGATDRHCGGAFALGPGGLGGKAETQRTRSVVAGTACETRVHFSTGRWQPKALISQPKPWLRAGKKLSRLNCERVLGCPTPEGTRHKSQTPHRRADRRARPAPFRHAACARRQRQEGRRQSGPPSGRPDRRGARGPRLDLDPVGSDFGAGRGPADFGAGLRATPNRLPKRRLGFFRHLPINRSQQSPRHRQTPSHPLSGADCCPTAGAGLFQTYPRPVPRQAGADCRLGRGGRHCRFAGNGDQPGHAAWLSVRSAPEPAQSRNACSDRHSRLSAAARRRSALQCRGSPNPANIWQSPPIWTRSSCRRSRPAGSSAQ